MSGDIPPKLKSRKKSKAADEKFDPMLQSASKISNRAASSMGEDTSGEHANPPPVAQRRTRRATDEINTSKDLLVDIPTISMNEAEGDNTIDMAPQVAVAPKFSMQQIASFKEIEREFSRERTSQYIDPKIDITILYHNLHLQEEDIGEQDHKPWDWDKVFVEIRNAVTNPRTQS